MLKFNKSLLVNGRIAGKKTNLKLQNRYFSSACKPLTPATALLLKISLHMFQKTKLWWQWKQIKTNNKKTSIKIPKYCEVRCKSSKSSIDRRRNHENLQIFWTGHDKDISYHVVLLNTAKPVLEDNCRASDAQNQKGERLKTNDLSAQITEQGNNQPIKPKVEGSK